MTHPDVLEQRLRPGLKLSKLPHLRHGRRLHALLSAQSVLLVLASINRLWSATDVPVLPHGSLRIVELLNLFVLPPLSVFVFWVMLEDFRPSRRLRFWFLAAVYLFALSYGMHEPTNYLHTRFCSGTGGSLCSIIAYQDDQLSHFVFFVGFAGIDAVLLFAQAGFGGARVVGRDHVWVGVNAALVAAAIVANLGFEEIGLDLVCVAAVAALSLWLWRRVGALPLVVYFGSSYVVGLVATVLIKAV
jgi:hypothetical protein